MGFEILPPKEEGIDWFEERQCPNCRRLEAEIARLSRLVEAFEHIKGIVEFTKNYPIHDRMDSILNSIQRETKLFAAEKEGHHAKGG